VISATRSFALILVATLAVLTLRRLDPMLHENGSMIQLSKCVVPARWVVDLRRAGRPTALSTPPDGRCLRALRARAGLARRLRARLELIDADVAAQQGEWTTAVVHYRSAIEYSDVSVAGLWNDIAAAEAWKIKDYPAALAASLDGLKSSPADEGLRTKAAMMYLYYVQPYSRYREAVKVMRPELGFSQPYYYNIAASCYLALGQSRQGLQMADEAVRLARAVKDPNLPAALYLKGVLLRCSGRDNAGIAALRESMAQAPSDQTRIALQADAAVICASVSANR
jgi:tetratricopeptide (TPR) repeat protein